MEIELFLGRVSRQVQHYKKRLKKLSFLGGKNPPRFFVLPVDTILFVKFSALNLSALLQDVDPDIFYLLLLLFDFD